MTILFILELCMMCVRSTGGPHKHTVCVCVKCKTNFLKYDHLLAFLSAGQCRPDRQSQASRSDWAKFSAVNQSELTQPSRSVNQYVYSFHDWNISPLHQYVSTFNIQNNTHNCWNIHCAIIVTVIVCGHTGLWAGVRLTHLDLSGGRLLLWRFLAEEEWLIKAGSIFRPLPQ